MIRSFIVSIFLFVLGVDAFSQSINSNDARNYIGKTVTVCGKIYNGRFLKNAKSKPTLLNMGAAYPDHHMTIVIYGEDLKQFPDGPERYYSNTDVCVTGQVIEYQGKPEIIARTSEQIKIVPVAGITPAGTPKVPSATAANNTTAGNTTTTTPKKTAVAEKSTASVAPAAQPKAANTGYEITLTGEVNMRTGPGKENAVLATLGVGSVVSISNSADGWSFVTVVKNNKDENTVGSTGYIKNSVLK